MEIRFALDSEQDEVENLALLDPHTKDFKYLWKLYKNWGSTNPIVAVDEVIGAVRGFHAVTFGKRNHYANSYYLYIAEGWRGQRIGGDLIQFMLDNRRGCTRLKFKTQFGSSGKEFWEGFGLRPFAKDDVQHLFDVNISNVNTVADLRSVGTIQDIPFVAMQNYLNKGAILL
jgi:GNAT superfamily N-acetyltransferase